MYYDDKNSERRAGTTARYLLQSVWNALMNRNPANGSTLSDDLALYQQLIEAAPVSMAILDAQQPALPLVYVNAAFEALTGYERADVVGSSVDFLLGSDQDASAAIRAGLAAQTAATGTIQSTRKTGARYWSELRIAPRYDARGKVTHFVAVQNDVTAYKQAEVHLRQSEERYRAAIEIMPDLIFYHAADTTILDYHAPSEIPLVVPPEHFVGKRIQEIFPPAQAKLFSTAVLDASTSRQPTRLEYSIETPDGLLEFEARYIPSGVDEIMAIIRDVTTLRQAERQSMSLTLEKERARLLAEFIRNASHEFRTPLSIIGSSAYLMARTDDPERRRYRLEQIEASVLRTTRLVDLLLKMVMLDTQLPNRAPVDVADVLHLLQTEILTPADAARIRFELASGLPTVAGYSEQLTDAVRQLVENALRYTPAEGQITVRAYPDGDSLMIEVEDTGIGISPEALPLIFETFWRQDEAHSTPGLGLGLSIAQKIVKLHGGQIEVASAVGHGSTFRIVLPRSRSAN